MSLCVRYSGIRKDIRFTLTSISLNLAFVALTFPISIANFLSSLFVDSIFKFCNLLFFSSYGVNFYFLFAFSKVIREEVYSFLRIKKPQTRVSQAPLRQTTAARDPVFWSIRILLNTHSVFFLNVLKFQICVNCLISFCYLKQFSCTIKFNFNTW